MSSRSYALGNTYESLNPIIESRQQNLDLLVSNLPAFETTTPATLDLQVVRDYDNWAPNIVYAIGTEGVLRLDCYFCVNPTFDGQVFKETILKMGIVQTNGEYVNMHEKIPPSY